MYYAGIDLGGTNIAVGIVDENYKITGRAKAPTPVTEDYTEIIDAISSVTLEAIKNAGIKKEDIEYAGIAAPGTVDPENGEVVYANNLPFRHTPIVKELEKKLSLKCLIANDANAAAYGELLAGAGRGCKNFIAITLGTGVGGGIVIDGKIYTGFNYSGGELGHIVLVAGGEKCTCGNNGCYEAYASATALVKQTRNAMLGDKESAMWEIVSGNIDNVNGRTAFDAMRLGDKTGKEVVKKYIEYIGYGIISLVNAFQPQFVCVGGGICNEGETLMEPLREMVSKGDYNKYLSSKTKVIRAELGNDAGIIGAAMLWKK